jgi:hypothetical protein
MITLNLTNTSGVAIVAGDGVLPRALSHLSIAIAGNANAVIQVGDLTKIENQHSGFTMGELLQSLKQRGKIAFTAADVAGTVGTGSVPDEVVATATV